MAIPGVKLAIGKQRFTEAPRWPSENGYIASINRQARGLERELKRIFEQFKNMSPTIIIKALQPTFAMTQVEVPRDTGELAASGYLQETSDRGKPSVEMGYGYRNSPNYAQLVHENMNAYHPGHTKAKFLQDPVMADLNNIFMRLAENYRILLMTGG